MPFCFESKLSGIGDTSIHDHVFYKRNFTVPEEWKGRRVLLHFEAVDYSCRVFVNESYVQSIQSAMPVSARISQITCGTGNRLLRGGL